MKWNVLSGVVEIIEAPDAKEAQHILDRKLETAGFSTYGLDMPPFESEEDTCDYPHVS